MSLVPEKVEDISEDFETDVHDDNDDVFFGGSEPRPLLQQELNYYMVIWYLIPKRFIRTVRL